MTPKEKAIELFNKFYEIEDSKLCEDAWIDSYLAKRCCLTAVDFAMEFITGNLDEAFDKTLYLFEVKEEIEKL
jgi:hypothetical protein